VDDIVVVDGGSKDDSVSAATAAGARVYVRAFDNDFAAQRNYGLSQLRECDWVLRFDDDERVGRGLAEMLQAALSSAGRCDVLLVPQALYVAGRRDPRTNLEAMVFRSKRRYRGALPEFPAWTRPLALPMTGPLLENHKSFEEMLVSNLLYGSIRPDDYAGNWLEDAQKTLDQIRKGAPPS
jgi:glycosyltransferase involved in cell wall biosynthesis